MLTNYSNTIRYVAAVASNLEGVPQFDKQAGVAPLITDYPPPTSFATLSTTTKIGKSKINP